MRHMLFHLILHVVVMVQYALQEHSLITEHVIQIVLQEQTLTIQTLPVYQIPLHVVQDTTFQETLVYRLFVVQDTTSQEIPAYRILTQTLSQVLQLLERSQ